MHNSLWLAEYYAYPEEQRPNAYMAKKLYWNTLPAHVQTLCATLAYDADTVPALLNAVAQQYASIEDRQMPHAPNAQAHVHSINLSSDTVTRSEWQALQAQIHDLTELLNAALHAQDGTMHGEDAIDQ